MNDKILAMLRGAAIFAILYGSNSAVIGAALAAAFFNSSRQFAR